MASKVAGTFRPTQRRPICSVGHKARPVKMPDGKWACPDCFNDHVGRVRSNRSAGGVVLPEGVRVTHNFFGDVFPNRRARRAAR